jgi:UDP-3-O-[3-hydroxymyristoyl] N-acetylglucosamine deacetylase
MEGMQTCRRPPAAESPLPISPAYQHTIEQPAIIAGVGCHTGQYVRLSIRPAPVGHGLVFVRTDLDGDNRIIASGVTVVQTTLGTVIGNAAGATVSTIEHLMAALAALAVDNLLIEVDGPEVPILDGSAEPFVQLLDRAGRRRQSAQRSYIEILEPIEVVEAGKRAALLPADRFEIAMQIDFPTAAIGHQAIDLQLDEGAFRRELADCRTFGFLHEVEALRRMGLARGGSLENAVVVDGDAILNPEGLRRPDEFVRHKALDAVGDLYVLGRPVLGRFEGLRAGHAINNLLVRALLERPQAWREVTLEPALAQAG